MAVTNTCGWEDPQDSGGFSGEMAGTSLTPQSSVVRTGVYAGVASGTASSSHYRISLKSDLDDDPGTGLASGWVRVYFRYAVKPTTGTAQVMSIKTFSPFGADLIVTIDANGQLSLAGASGSAGPGSTVLAQDTWYRLELKFTISDTGAYELKIDGTTELSGTIDQKFSTATVANWVYVGWDGVAPGSTCTFYYDDLSVNDSVAPGPGAILRLSVNANGTHTGWVAGTGSGGFEEYDEVLVDGDTTYVTTSTNNTAESGNCESFADKGVSSITSINSVKAIGWVRDESQTCAWRIGIRSGSTDSYGGSGDNASAAYLLRMHIRDTDPSTSAAWTESGVNAAQCIAQHQQTQSRALRLSAMCLMVDYVPAGTPPSPQKLYSIVQQSRVRASRY